MARALEAAKRFAPSGVLFLAWKGLDVSGVQDIRLALVFWGLAAAWALVAALTWKPLHRRLGTLPGWGRGAAFAAGVLLLGIVLVGAWRFAARRSDAAVRYAAQLVIVPGLPAGPQVLPVALEVRNGDEEIRDVAATCEFKRMVSENHIEVRNFWASAAQFTERILPRRAYPIRCQPNVDLGASRVLEAEVTLDLEFSVPTALGRPFVRRTFRLVRDRLGRVRWDASSQEIGKR